MPGDRSTGRIEALWSTVPRPRPRRARRRRGPVLWGWDVATQPPRDVGTPHGPGVRSVCASAASGRCALRVGDSE